MLMPEHLLLLPPQAWCLCPGQRPAKAECMCTSHRRSQLKRGGVSGILHVKACIKCASLHLGHLILDCWLATSSFPSRLGSFPSPHLLCQIIIDTLGVPQDHIWRIMIALRVHGTIQPAAIAF